MYEDDDYELQASSSDDMGGLSAGDDDIEVVVGSFISVILVIKCLTKYVQPKRGRSSGRLKPQSTTSQRRQTESPTKRTQKSRR